MTGEMNVLDATGDTRIQWRKTNPDEVAAAEKRFTELKGKGFIPYKVVGATKESEVLHRFDPSAERILFVPPSIGG